VLQLSGQLDAASCQPAGFQHDHLLLRAVAALHCNWLRHPHHAGQQHWLCHQHVASLAQHDMALCFCRDRPDVQGYPDACQQLLLRLRPYPVRGRRLLYDMALHHATGLGFLSSCSSLHRYNLLVPSLTADQAKLRRLLREECFCQHQASLELHSRETSNRGANATL